MGLEFVEIVMSTEERFGIKFDEAAFDDCRTYGQLVDTTVSTIQQQLVRTTDTHDEVDEWLRNLLVTAYLVKPEHIVRDAELMGPELDLG